MQKWKVGKLEYMQYFFNFLHLFIWQGLGEHVTAHMWRSEDKSSFSILWVLGITLKFSGLIAGAFAHWTTLPGLVYMIIYM